MLSTRYSALRVGSSVKYFLHSFPWVNPIYAFSSKIRYLHDATSSPVPFRKQFRDEQRKRKLEGQAQSPSNGSIGGKAVDWELTVGIEIHAQLNTDLKLFSGKLLKIPSRPPANLLGAAAVSDAPSNTIVALFDLALPGSQPVSK